MIRGIVFDLDGVYFLDGKKNFIKNVSEKYGIDRSIVADLFLKSDLMIKYKTGKLSGKEFWGKAIKNWGIKTTPEELITILKEGYHLNSYANKLIHKIKAHGIKTIICSDNFPERIKALDDKLSFIKDFDFAVFSYEYKLLKPQLFEKLPGATKISKEELIIIDNNAELINAAKRAGFKAIYCDKPQVLSKIIINKMPLKRYN